MIHEPSRLGGSHLAAIVSPVDHIIHYSIEKSSHVSALFLVRAPAGLPKWLQLEFSFGHRQIAVYALY